MPSYFRNLPNSGAEFGLLGTGLAAFTDSFQRERQYQDEKSERQKRLSIEDEQRALQNRQRDRAFELDIAEHGLEQFQDADGSTKFRRSAEAVAKEKRDHDEKYNFEKFKSGLSAAEDRRKEQSSFQRAITTELLKKGQMPIFDAKGNLTGTRAASPASGLMSQAPQTVNGVNEGLLNEMIDTGQLDKTAGRKATEEYGKHDKMIAELEEADKVFDLAKENATRRGRISRNAPSPHALGAAGGVGGFLMAGPPGAAAGGGVGEAIGYALRDGITLGDEQTKRYRGAVDPFVDKLTKDTSGRVTPITFEKISSVMPEQGDDEGTLQTKRDALHRLIRSSYLGAFPTLKRKGLLNEAVEESVPAKSGLTPEEQKEFEALDAKYRKPKK